MKFNVGDKITPINPTVTVMRVDNTTPVQWIMISGDRTHWHQADEFELAQEDACTWKQEESNDYSGVWHTDCGNAHLLEGTPEEDHATFCQYCGKKIKAVPVKSLFCTFDE